MRHTNRTGFWAMVDHNGAVFGVGTSETEARADARVWISREDPTNEGRYSVAPCSRDAFECILDYGYDAQKIRCENRGTADVLVILNG